MQIMQFTTSQGTHYQGSTLIDPCMVLVPPVEQYGYNTTFKSAPRQSGAGSTFNEHFVSLYIKGPVDENNQYVSNPAALKEILDSIEVIINGNIGTGVYRDAAVERNRIPGTNYHYARFSVDADATIHVKAKTEMSGTSYGFGPAISYAWPTAMGLVQAGVEDIYPPAVRNTRACETPDGSAASLRPGTSTINPGATYVRSY